MTRKNDKRCEVPACEAPRRTRGLCSMHHQRWMKYGDPGDAKPKLMRAAGMTCTVDNCGKPVRCVGLCAAHYRLARTSDTCICGKRKSEQANMCSDCYNRARDATEITEKVCTHCQTLLPIEAYAWRKYAGGHKRRSRCHECEKKIGRENSAKARSAPGSKEKRSAYRKAAARTLTLEEKQLRSVRSSARRYGLDPDAVVRVWDEQGHACAICHQPPAPGRRLHLDHCHDTGTLRGFLCSSCNTGLGQFKDSPDLLSAAIGYLAATPQK